MIRASEAGQRGGSKKQMEIEEAEPEPKIGFRSSLIW